MNVLFCAALVAGMWSAVDLAQHDYGKWLLTTTLIMLLSVAGEILRQSERSSKGGVK